MSFNIVKCSDIIDVRDGTHDSPKYIDKGFPLITSKNIKNNSIDFENVNFISEEDYNKINMRSSVENGDILMPMIGTVGNPVLVNSNNKFAIKNVALFKLSQNSKINSKYFYYLLMSNTVLNQLERHKRGGTQSFVSLKNLRELKIPYISIEKQKKIVGVLDKAQELIDKRKEQIEELDKLVKSRFIEMFGDPVLNPKGWDVKEVGECCILKSGTSISKDIENEGGDIPYIKVGDMNCNGNEKYINTSTHFVSESTAGDGIFEIGTVIFPKRGGAIGTNKKRLTKSLICADLNVMGVTPNNEIHPEYLYLYFVNIDMNTLNNGSSVPQINNKDIAPLKIQVPPFELQNQFADFVQQVDKLKFEMEKSLKELEDNFNSLMQKAFKGELF